MEPETAVTVVAAIIALASMIAAFWQAGSARRQTNLQQRALEDASQPYVWADIRPDDRNASFFHLILKNEGPTVAEHVRVVIDPPLPDSWRQSGAVGPRHTDFASLPPGRTMIWNLGPTHEIVNSDTAKQFDITISAKGPFGQVLPHTYRLDLNQYTHNAMRSPGTLAGVTTALDNLTKQIKTKPGESN
ncbi:MAG: hypothetical protein EOP31_26540 [Rhodococcus sp. (in: high G+C Gram-positive bacteria)]|uniref:hypothetical protein n=1 Tax=Rhodococcus sp. TaxID=1831 RepID=UPI0012055E5E|nr:hypothetical protein [Rhodococcus sp. (in: high G+C Gram-positive bacteria)]RZL21842.1 MAG: hypothetical protein EOP31_26540 [Rhodococcus sp. (in: high G+C Gram-positive bacteria)]